MTLAIGTVVQATLPTTIGRFWEPKARSLVVTGSHNGVPLAVPTTCGKARRVHLEPNPENGLWGPVELITNIRFSLTDPNRFEVLGHLTAGELIALRKTLRGLTVAQTWDL